MKQHLATHRAREGAPDELPQRGSPSLDASNESRAKANRSPSLPPPEDLRDEEKADSRIKRGRDGEISLPDAKRASGK